VAEDRSNEYTLITDAAGGTFPELTRGKVVVLSTANQAAVAASASGRRSVSDMWKMGRALSSPSFDVLLFPSIYTFVPTITRARKIVIMHDVIAETFPQLTVPRFSARLFWRAKVALGRHQADALVTVSEYSKRGIVRHFGVAPERVHVVGEASDPIFRRLADSRLTPYLERTGIRTGHRLVTYVGGFGPHKNLPALVHAFARVANDPAMADVRLVIAGEYSKEIFHSEFATVKSLTESLGVAGRVIFTGYIPDEELVVLLNMATVLVLPSLMEGFGLPAVEAAACGCPVIATRESPLPELLDGAGRFIDPRGDDLAEALREVLACPELRHQMSRTGIERAARLSWSAAARQMMGVLQAMAV
jgi:glycosyltransferase involved in cell wall biosynthesis